MSKIKRFKPFKSIRLALRRWIQRFRDYADHCIQSGFVPLTFGPAQFIARQLARLMVFIQLGRLRIIGEGNLRLAGRFIFCPNHSAMFDAPVLYAIMKRKESVRYMTAFEEMRGLWGLKAIAMGATGCFPVDRTRGKSVIEPAIEILVNGQNLAIFPEGKISETGACLPFKKGPAIIATSALQRLESGERVGIIPINIHYHLRDVATARSGDFRKMGFKWRGGVTVTVGEPIYLDEVKGMSPDEIMEKVHKAVCRAQDCALRLGCPIQ